MGGNVASLYAGIRPGRCRWVASLEGFGLPRSSSDQAPARYAEWLDELREPPRNSRYESVAQLAMVLKRRNHRLPAAHAEFLAAAWSRPRTEGGIELRADPWHRLVNPMLYRREEAEACWRRADLPMLLVLGADSDFHRRLGPDGNEASFRGLSPAAPPPLPAAARQPPRTPAALLLGARPAAARSSATRTGDRDDLPRAEAPGAHDAPRIAGGGCRGDHRLVGAPGLRRWIFAGVAPIIEGERCLSGRCLSRRPLRQVPAQASDEQLRSDRDADGLRRMRWPAWSWRRAGSWAREGRRFHIDRQRAGCRGHHAVRSQEIFAESD